MQKPLLLLCSIAIFVFSACNNSANQKQGNAGTTTGLKIEPKQDSYNFPGSRISIVDIKSNKAGDSANITFTFKVDSFELGVQTPGADSLHIANSANGQHIHFIMDNGPYTALYKPIHEVTLPVGTEHTLLAFLSRSYHESVKSSGAALLLKFKIDNKGQVKSEGFPDEPELFYSRPKGSYSGADTQKVLLDFYLWHANLGDSLQVKATINDTSFMINHWQPYYIENAPTGELNIKLQLQNKNGLPINSEFNSAERHATLEPGQ